MKEQQFKKSLNHLAEQAFPDDGQAWQKVQQRIAQEPFAAKPCSRRWAPMMAAIALLVVAVFLLTPAGAALAKMLQNITFPL